MKKNIWPKVADDLNRLSILNKNLLELINPCFIKWTEENILIDKKGAIKINLENRYRTRYQVYSKLFYK